MLEKNVLITGASGLLGRAVYKYFTDDEFQKKYPIEEGNQIKWKCIGLCNKRVKNGLTPLDLTNPELVLKFVQETKPDAIIHCAAEKRVENIEKNYENSVKLNCGSTAFLADICAKMGIVFVYISTDYIFDGKNPPYKIDAQTNPLSKYGETKLEGEKATKQASDKHCIVRVPVLYGHTEANNFSESAINTIYADVAKLTELNIDNIQIRYPTHCIDVARFLMQLLYKRFSEGHEQQIRGVFHCSALESFTKYEVACIIADLFQIDKSHIKPDVRITPSSQLRPMNSQLETQYTYKLINYHPIMKFKCSIRDCLENFVV